jgi:galactitol-specific phosphotransferase system IIB component
MPDTVLVAIITVCGGGVFTLIFRLVERLTDKANQEVTRNSEAVVLANQNIQGMDTVINQLRIESERKDKTITKLEAELETYREMLRER